MLSCRIYTIVALIFSAKENCSQYCDDWGRWSSCSVTCGQGTKQRTASCYEGGDYSFTKGQSSWCIINPVHGGWSIWDTWGVCSKTCSSGTRVRYRQCNNPRPANCGNICTGSNTDIGACNSGCCPVNGNWGTWGAWTQCSVTCGQGVIHSERTCTNPAPVCGGAYCVGNSVNTQQCQIPPVHGIWSQWNQFGPCSEACNGGTRVRNRTCDNPTPLNCGNNCSGNNVQSEECNTQVCIASDTGQSTTKPTERFDSTKATTYLPTPTRNTNGRNLTEIVETMTTTSNGVDYSTIGTPNSKAETTPDADTMFPSTTIGYKNSLITQAWPNYGPQAGGTVVTIYGNQLPPGGVVRLGDTLYCDTVYANDTIMLVVTPKLAENQKQKMEKFQQIYIVMGMSRLVKSSQVFVYKPNPAIHRVYPKETIKQGGTILTVLGTNLDSVAVVTMQTTMVVKKLVRTNPVVFNVTSSNYNTVCSTVNSTQVYCPTPSVDLPPGFHNGSHKRRGITNTRSMMSTPSVKIRQKRDVKIQFSNNGDEVEFYIGFNLDGVQDYNNYTAIDVFLEPELIFTAEMKEYENDTRLQFQGSHLDVGVTVYDYNITIGKGVCGQLELLTNMLSCTPPGVKPDLEDGNTNGHPMIMIHVGLNIDHMAGHISYPERTLPLYILILAAAIPTCVLIIIIVTVVVCVKKRQNTG